MKTFTDLGVSENLIKALKELNIVKPTEIQVKAISFLIQRGTDFIGQAETGTGKTAAFGLPILQAIDPDIAKVQALILSPTRELVQQTARHLFKFTKYSTKKIFVESVYGGPNLEEQIRALKRPTHVVVGTPGRLIDLLKRKAIDLSSIKTLVLDEADEMLSMGFKKELDEILRFTAGKRHTWLFSATMPPEIKSIISGYMSPGAMRITVNKHDVMNRNIEHQFIICRTDEKTNVLSHFLTAQGENRGLVFCRTRANAQILASQLVAKSFNAKSLHGDLLQKDRDKVMRAFKNKKLQILVATDLAARGIDVEDLSYVVHYELPERSEYYTHRSGRTGRAGRKGYSVSLIKKTEQSDLKNIEQELGLTMQEIRQ